MNTQSQSELLMVNPNDLVIDMPLDETNVKQKMESLKQSGLIQPVVVWLNDMRIIDGFHRTEAARRLEWKEIPVFVRDCPEEAFWDARIQSARQHHEITLERLATWIGEAWRSSIWFGAFKPFADSGTPQKPHERPGRKYQKHATLSPTPEQRSVAEAMWWLISESYRRTGERDGDWKGMPLEWRALARWFSQKGELWQMTTEELIESIWGIFGYPRGERLDEIAASWGLSFSERNEAAGLMIRANGYGYGDKNVTVSWTDAAVLDDHLANGNMLEAVGRARKEWSEERRKRRRPSLREALTGESETQRQIRLAQSKTHTRELLVRALDGALRDIRGRKKQLVCVDDGAALLVRHCRSLVALVNELWPGTEDDWIDGLSPLAKENVRLRDEVAELRRENAALKRALDSKRRADERLPSTYAYSSEDIEKMPG